ncbi:MAG: 50S ribosomal protein L5, partial [Candidatus Anstonellales archaeon]
MTAETKMQAKENVDKQIGKSVNKQLDKPVKSSEKAYEKQFSEPFIEKVTINIGVGEQSEKLDAAEELLKRLTGRKPLRTKAKKRVPAFGIRPGLNIGVKVTLRKNEAVEMLKRLLSAKKQLKESNFDNNGNFSFGIAEYIDVPGLKYDPKIGMYGFDVCVTLAKKGIRVAKRKLKKAKVGKNQAITKQEAIDYIKKMF